jgi:hypothetical protein
MAVDADPRPGDERSSDPRSNDLLLPPRSRLIHIGPHKTGTTALQAALWGARDELRRQGVRHAGPTTNPVTAVRAVTRSAAYGDDRPPPMALWRALVREIAGAPEPRLIVSSEFFAAADPAAIRSIVHDLDPGRVHVAVTLRPLVRIIPSMWQQNVQAGRTAPFERWLRGLFPEPDGKANAAFWTLHRHDALVERWADVVGAERVTVVVLDDADRAFVLRVFERLLGLRPGTLALDRDRSNRSFTLPEVEAVRAFNRAFRASGLPEELHGRVMRYGAAQLMKRRRPRAEEAPVEMPPWAIERATDVQREIVARIANAGVRVVGDLGRLSEADPRPGPADGPTDERRVGRRRGSVPPEVAASMAMGVLEASGAARRPAMRLGRLRFAEPVELARVSTLQLAAVLVGRTKNALVARAHHLRRTDRGR